MLPVSFENSTVGPVVRAFAVEVVIVELAFVVRAVVPLEFAVAELLALLELTSKPGAIGPPLRSLALVQII